MLTRIFIDADLRKFAGILAVSVLCSCSSGPAMYTFAGCESADAGDPKCGDAARFACAVDHIQAQNSACNADADCTVVFMPVKCTAACQIPVNAAQAGSFNDLVATESTNFCATQSLEVGICVINPSSNALCEGCVTAVCRNGTCAITRTADAGCN